MISLGEIKFDSHDSGPGTIEVLSEGEFMYIRIHKLGPEQQEESHRPMEKRDPETYKVFKLHHRSLRFLGQWRDKYIRR